MANLAKESAISLASGDIGSLLGDAAQLGQTASNNKMPPEMMQLLSELPKWTAERASALDRIKQAYDEDPRMRMTPAQAHGRAMFNNANPYDPGYSLAMGRMAEDEQNQYVRDSKVAREKAVLDALDLGTFDKLYTNVAKNMNASKAQIHGSADTGFYSINPATNEQKLVIPGVMQQRQKDRLRNIILTERLKQGGDDKAAANYADKLAHEIIFKYSPEEVEDYINRNGNATTLISDQKLPPKPKENYQELDIQAIDKELSRPGISPATKATLLEQKQRLTNPTAPAYQGTPIQVASENKMAKAAGFSTLPPLKTPDELKHSAEYEGEAGKLASTEASKVIPDAISQHGAMRKNLIPMESMVLSGKLNTGPLHEFKSELGGFINYFDPEQKIAQASSNDQAYFGNLMNVAREKIKALGAGTAVSNLDLITTLKSLGDLRNNPQGILKLTGILNYLSLLQEDQLKNKQAHIAKEKRMDNWVPDTKNFSHALTYKRVSVPGSDQTLWQLIPISKQEWADSHGGKMPNDRDWNEFAAKSFRGSADIDSYIGAYQKGKVKK